MTHRSCRGGGGVAGCAIRALRVAGYLIRALHVALPLILLALRLCRLPPVLGQHGVEVAGALLAPPRLPGLRPLVPWLLFSAHTLIEHLRATMLLLSRR